MSEKIITEITTAHKFESIDDIVSALAIQRETTFTTEIAYIGGHGDVLLARADDDGIEPEMLVRANGQGWTLGQWGCRFGHVDVEATTELQQAVTRCRDCGAVIGLECQYPGLGRLCWDCLKRYAQEATP